MPRTDRPKRVLLVDDDEDLRQIFAFAMQKEGFSVAVAQDGVEGLEKLPVFRPHIIVLDVMMPRLNGFEFLHRMQQQGFKIPVIVITGFSASANEQILRQEANVLGYFTKPLNYAEIAAHIRRYLESK